MRKLLLASAATLGGLLATTGGALAQPVKAPAPGTVTVHLNGLLSFEIGVGSTANGPSAKYNSINTSGYIRLYPGVDATTLSGLQYGAQVELRTSTSLPNGAGVNGSGTSSNGLNTLFVRRAYGYVGEKQAGYIRFGQTDSAFSLLATGDLEGFGDAQQWNTADSYGNALPAGIPNNLFSIAGAIYTTQKVVYISPSFSGFNFIVGFEPNSNGFQEGVTALSAESSIPGSSNKRRRNTIDGMVGYSTNLNGALIKLSAGYLEGSPLGSTTSIATTSQYKSMGIAQFGGQVTYAGFAVGVNYKYGQVNDGYAFILPGQRKDNDFLVSGTYTMGPVIVGASYFFNQSAGAHTVGSKIARTETNDGIAIGANYNFDAHFNTFVQYLYGSVHQPGVAFKNSAGDVVALNGIHSNALAVGATIKW